MSEGKPNPKSHELLKGTLIYAIGNIGTKVLSFLIVPLYTYFISTEQNGIYENLLTASSLLIPLLTLQIGDAVYTRLLQKESQNNESRELIACAYKVCLAGTVLAVVSISLSALFFPFPCWQIFIFYVISLAWMQVMQKIVRAFSRQSLFAFSGLFYTAIFLSLNVIQIVFLHGGIESLLLSSVLACLTTIAFLLLKEPQLRVSPWIKTGKGILSSLLHFSIPLIPNQINWWVMNSSDKFLITLFLGLSANGIYGIACKFPSLLLMVMDFFNTSWMDFAIAGKGSEERGYYSHLFEKLYLFGFSLLIPLTPLTMFFIEWIMAPGYKAASAFVGFLYLGTIFQAFSSFYGVGYLKSSRTISASSTSIYGALANAAVDLALLNLIGLQAASLSTFIGFFVMWIIRERQNRTALEITISWPLFLAFFSLALAAILGCLYFGFIVQIILLLAGTLFFLVVNKDLIAALLQLVTGLIKKRA